MWPLPLEKYTDLPNEEIKDLVRLKLSLVGLGGFEKFYPSEISGGMAKRAGLARAIALDPEILFFDVPSAGLDPISSRNLDNLIMELRNSLGATVVVVTHELASIFDIADNSVFLDPEEKIMITQGDPNVLLKESSNSKVIKFLSRGKMIKNANSTVIGSFIIGAVILIVVVFLVFGSRKLFVTTNQFVIYFRSSPQGLSIGTPVKLKGVKIMEVTKITPIYDTKGTFNVEVIIEIMEGVVKRIGDKNPQEAAQQKVKNLVAKAVKAQLESESMVTGKLYVRLDFLLMRNYYLRDITPIYLRYRQSQIHSNFLNKMLKRYLTAWVK